MKEMPVPSRESTPATVTVAVASVGRAQILRANLEALQAQTDLPDEVIVIAQVGDTATRNVAQECDVRLVLVAEPGLAFAIEAAIAAAHSTVIAFVDDDARALPDWVARIRRAFSDDPQLGLLGGRDNLEGDRLNGHPGLRVGLMIRGKIIGNHHRGQGVRRPSTHVKGANMAVRVAPARRVPLARLVRGTGAQVRNEFILSLAIASQGFHGLYDPALQVDHYPAARQPGDDRSSFTRERTTVIRYNETIALALYGSRRNLALFTVRATLLGDRNCYGLAHFLLRAMQGDAGALDRFLGSLSGIGAAFRAAPRLRAGRLSNAG